MSVFKSRAAYFPSTPTHTSPGFSSYWGDTSQAVTLTGVWDTPSGSADADTAANVTQGGGSAAMTCCILQYIFPAFGALMDFSAPSGGPGGYLNVNSPVAMGLFSKTSGNPPVGNIVVRAIAKVLLYSSGNVLKFESGSPNLASGPALSTTLKGSMWDFGPSSLAEVSFAPLATDYMVVEVGVAALQCLIGSSPHNYTISAEVQSGDGHAAWQTVNSTIAGNCGIATVGWWGAAITASNKAPQFFRPRKPTRLALHMQSPTEATPAQSTLNSGLLNNFIL